MSFRYPSRTRRNALIAQARSLSPSAEIWLAGRVIGILDDGFVLQDNSGRTDVFFPVNTQREGFEVGDILEVRIVPVKNNGEFSRPDLPLDAVFLQSHELFLLAPCTSEFFIRREDPNYRKAVVDLHCKERLIRRTLIFQKIREFFHQEGFVEADTPSLVRLPGMEPYLDVFKTRLFPDPDKKKTPQDFYLVTSPEYALKKLLVGGFEKVFQIARSFRNKETDSMTHNPEFSLLEWYRAYASYVDIMDDTERLLKFLAVELFSKPEISYLGHRIDLRAPWKRLRVREAFEMYAGVSSEDFEDPTKFKELAAKRGYVVADESTYDDAFFLIFMNEIEQKLGFDQPVILYEYPASMAALSKVCEENPKYAERFEVYIAGMELANAFTELNDPVEQGKRLEAERLERQKLGKDDYPVDRRFLEALELGMPPSGGIALGVDRLVMLFTDTPDIQNVLFFPLRDL